MVKTIEYLSLSALAYADFKKSDAGLTLDEIIRDEQKKKSRKEFDLDRPQLSALRDSSNPLRSWKASSAMYLFGYKACGKIKGRVLIV